MHYADDMTELEVQVEFEYRVEMKGKWWSETRNWSFPLKFPWSMEATNRRAILRNEVVTWIMQNIDHRREKMKRYKIKLPQYFK